MEAARHARVLADAAARWLRAYLCIALICAFCVPLAPVHGIDRAEAKNSADTVKMGLSSYGQVHYDGYSTFVMEDEDTGNTILCINPDRSSAPAGTYRKDYDVAKYMEENSNGDVSARRVYLMRALEYYGNPDSPGYDEDIWPDEKWDGSRIAKSDRLSVLHVALAVNAKKFDAATYGTSTTFKNWVKKYISGGYAFGDGQDHRPNSMYGKLTGGDAEGGTHLDNKYHDNLPDAFKIYVISTGGAYQNYIGFEYDDVAVQVKKSYRDDDGQGFNGMSLYSKKGAVFAIYDTAAAAEKANEKAENANGGKGYKSAAEAREYAKDSEADAVITTDENGAGKATGLARGKYWIVELRAPEGADRKNKVFTANATKSTYSEEKPFKLEVEDTPQMAQIDLFLEKVGETGEPQLPDGDATLAGAVFKVEYFAALEDDGGPKASGKAMRTWYFKTDANGRIRTDDAHVADYLDHGDDMFRNASGKTAFPLGTYKITETTAPTGYLKDKDVQYLTIGAGADRTLTTTGNTARYGNVVENDAGDPLYQNHHAKRGGFIVGKGDAELYQHADGTYYSYAQGDASFAGAEFTVYNRSKSSVWDDLDGDGKVDAGELFGPGDAIRVLKTEYNEELDAYTAQTRERELPYGTYEIVETKAPRGYLNTGTVSKVIELREDGQFVELVQAKGMLNDILRGGVQVEKDDLELAASEALGGAGHSALDAPGYQGSSLSGIEFTVTNASAHGVMVEGAYYPVGAVITRLSTAWNPAVGAYTAQTPAEYLPYGTYTVAETATNGSYLLTDGAPRTFEVREKGKLVTASVDAAKLVWRDQVVRNDLHLQKKTDWTDEHIGLVPFLITNVTTGERHVAVTDRNGMLDTRTTWRAHSENTNANDGLVGRTDIRNSDIVEDSGVWFGLGEHGSMAAVDDGLGALPYGKYTVEELRCEANEGHELWNDTLFVYRDTTATPHDTDMGTVNDGTPPEISTTATDKADGDHMAQAAEKTTIVDTVRYANLTAGKVYTLLGTLMDKATGQALLDAGGKPVTATLKFTPKSEFGEVELAFTFDARGIGAAQTVAFERLMQGDTTVAVHEDLDDEGQTVSIPGIGTTLADGADGDRLVDANGTVTLVDTVRYEGLVADGTRYTLVGTLMDKETGKPLKDALGRTVTATAEFVPETPSGTQEVVFEFDASHVAGRQAVAFEKLYHNGLVVTVHEDIGDKEQTVNLVGMGTTLADASDGDHDAVANGAVTLVDTVRYEGLVADGTRYTLVGTLMDKETGQPLADAQGDGVSAHAEFAPADETGAYGLEFSFDASLLAGKAVVAFERLYRDGVLVASHEDIGDEGQTVTFADEPAQPEEPAEPEEPDEPAELDEPETPATDQPDAPDDEESPVVEENGPDAVGQGAESTTVVKTSDQAMTLLLGATFALVAGACAGGWALQRRRELCAQAEADFEQRLRGWH